MEQYQNGVKWNYRLVQRLQWPIQVIHNEVTKYMNKHNEKCTLKCDALQETKMSQSIHENTSVLNEG